ncbi:hypothetical protein FUA23_15400 [Neolewinella aurantiaca]|uniref:Secreted protein (Por secretion system target) n=1 Tax=Neolewinella aurantiaca TaxID=2602767 RepID=A0A5C7FQQ3_9BACT|nr:hypothetical protein [Neolewinella aurantiaca]TXF88364.1 hypothetical protein FUA23_15400 [Neolewinella aurantiaca]
MKNLIYPLFALFILSIAPAAAPLSAAPQIVPALTENSATAKTIPVIDEPLIVRSKLVEGGMELLIANLEQSKTTISITSLQTNREVFTDQVRNHNGYSYNLNMDELKPGRYVLSVTKGKEVRKQVLLVKKSGITCSAWK